MLPRHRRPGARPDARPERRPSRPDPARRVDGERGRGGGPRAAGGAVAARRQPRAPVLLARVRDRGLRARGGRGLPGRAGRGLHRRRRDHAARLHRRRGGGRQPGAAGLRGGGGPHRSLGRVRARRLRHPRPPPAGRARGQAGGDRRAPAVRALAGRGPGAARGLAQVCPGRRAPRPAAVWRRGRRRPRLRPHRRAGGRRLPPRHRRPGAGRDRPRRPPVPAPELRRHRHQAGGHRRRPDPAAGHRTQRRAGGRGVRAHHRLRGRPADADGLRHPPAAGAPRRGRARALDPEGQPRPQPDPLQRHRRGAGADPGAQPRPLRQPRGAVRRDPGRGRGARGGDRLRLRAEEAPGRARPDQAARRPAAPGQPGGRLLDLRRAVRRHARQPDLHRHRDRPRSRRTVPRSRETVPRSRRAVAGAEGRALSRDAEDLARENAKLRKINEVLMRRVERSMDMQGNDYALFETAILLEAKIRDRTKALEQALAALQGSNRALAEAKAEAERANQSKTRFLAAASHDLLQPLNAARLFLSALSETECHPRARQLIGSTEAAFESIERLLASLLDISKLDAGVMAAEPRDVPLGPLLRALAAEFAPMAERKGLELRAVPTSAVVRTDPDLLLRILRNLLSNAVRYTPEGRVLLGVRRRGGGLAVEVGDTGVGIPPERQAEIFEEFRRLGTDADARDRGFGLGLAIVERIARLLGHPVEVRSRVGRGARFILGLPAGGPLPDAAEPEVRRGPVPGRLEGALVVVIENERAIRDGMRALLETWGCEVLGSPSAAEALSALQAARRRPDLVIADYHLDRDELGPLAVASLREAFGGPLPGLVITADRTPEGRERLAAARLPTLAH